MLVLNPNVWRVAGGPRQQWLSHLPQRFLRQSSPERFHRRSLSSSPSPPVKSWVEYLPPKAWPYAYLARVDKPIGTLLLFYPCGLCAIRRV
jgi:hypothetical protein